MLETFDPDIRACASHIDLARESAVEVVDLLKKKPDAVIGLATGNTQKPFYEDLVRLHRADLDFSRARFVNLDEYIGLPADSPQSFRAWMQKQFFSCIGARPQNIYIPDGIALDPRRECERYEKLIRSLGGIDLQLLGLGVNAHVGFNEPGSPFDSRTHVATLTEETRRSNASEFGGDWRRVPEFAITMGLGTILEARRVVLLANGFHKRPAVEALLTAPLSIKIPATALRQHPDLKIFIDWEAFPFTPRVAARMRRDHAVRDLNV